MHQSYKIAFEKTPCKMDVRGQPTHRQVNNGGLFQYPHQLTLLSDKYISAE